VQITTFEPLQFPAGVPFDATFVSCWARQDASTPVSAQMRLRVLGPHQEELLSGISEIDLRTALRSRNLGTLSGLNAGGPGTHEFEVSWRLNDADQWHAVALIPVDIGFQVEPANMGAGSPPSAATP